MNEIIFTTDAPLLNFLLQRLPLIKLLSVLNYLSLLSPYFKLLDDNNFTLSCCWCRCANTQMQTNIQQTLKYLKLKRRKSFLWIPVNHTGNYGGKEILSAYSLTWLTGRLVSSHYTLSQTLTEYLNVKVLICLIRSRCNSKLIDTTSE